MAQSSKGRAGRLRRWVFRVGVAAAAITATLVVLGVTGWSERLFFYPVRAQTPPPPGGEAVSFVSEGRTLHGWFLPAETGAVGTAAPTVVHCHGNAFHIGRHGEFVGFLPPAGFNVLIFDYRSYGMSDRGPLDREGLIADARAAVDYAASRDDVDGTRIGLFGLSLGGTIGLAAAAEDERVRAVCSVATFSAWKGVAGDFVPWVGPLIVRGGRDATASARGLGQRPLLLLHGTDDGIVPHRHLAIIRDAAEEAGVPVEARSFEGVGHVDWVRTTPEMREAIVAFFAEHLGAGGAGTERPAPGESAPADG